MTAEDVSTLVLDTDLSPDACRVILYVGGLGEGTHEVKQTRFASLLNHPGEKRVRTAVQVAVDSGFLKRSPGGKGHSDLFEFSPALRASLNADRLAPAASLLAPVVVVDVVDVNPPKSPTVGFLQPEAETAIRRYGELLAGGRDAIRDYLRDVVPLSRQAAWVDDIAGKINGLGINWKGVELGDRPGLVAAAVNELRASGEGEMKYQPGDPRNTRTKLGVLIDSRVSPMRYGGGARASPKRGQPAEGDYGEGTTTFEGLNG